MNTDEYPDEPTGDVTEFGVCDEETRDMFYASGFLPRNVQVPF